MHPLTAKRDKLTQKLKQDIDAYGAAMAEFGRKRDPDSQDYIARKKAFMSQSIHNLVEAAIIEGMDGEDSNGE